MQIAIEEGLGGAVIHASPERIQMMRHQVTQLGGIGMTTVEEIQALRQEN
jgi:hypothetical protein